MPPIHQKSLEECLAQAAKARAEAAETPLENVRIKLLASAEAWEAQATTERRFADLRRRQAKAASDRSVD